MKYRVRFPNSSSENKFKKILSKIANHKIQDDIMEAVESLSANPRPFGKSPFKKLKPPMQFYQLTAQYRMRIGNYRVLYDVDDRLKIVWILALRKREAAYR